MAGTLVLFRLLMNSCSTSGEKDNTYPIQPVPFTAVIFTDDFWAPGYSLETNPDPELEAAVAYYKVTGKRKLLDISIRSADLVDQTFGWGKGEDCPGYQEIEIGLVKLYDVTGGKKYLDLARFFLDVRGSLVYAVEGIDNGGSAMEIGISPEPEFTSRHMPELLNGVTVIRMDGLQAIPYYSWANRGPSDMRV